MRDRVIYYGAYLFAVLQIVAILFMLKDAYGRDVGVALLMLIPPLFCIKALRNGPDCEERKLIRQVRKARLAQELEQLTKK